jgi:hypothetical protein
MSVHVLESYVPTSIDKAEMHFTINGEDHGPCAKELPLTDPFLMRQFFFVDGFLLWLKLNVRENSFN